MVKKTRSELALAILEKLAEKPLSTQQVSESVESNWSTVNEVLEELKKEGKVKEIVSTDKIKIYQRITGDTYFEIPIAEDEKKKFRTLFFWILQEYKSRGTIPTKTHLAKATVSLIKRDNKELIDLPVVWYIYGMIPLMIADPAKDYQEEFNFEHKIKIKSLIKEYIDENGSMSSGQIQKKQHLEYNGEIYQLSDALFDSLNESKLNKDNILNLLNKLFIACPIDNDFPEIFGLMEKFVSIVNKLSVFSNLNDNRKEISATFDALWKFIATYKFYKSLIEQKRFLLNQELIFNLYIRSTLEVRRNCLEESLSNLYSIYLNKLDDREIEISPEVEKIREIMEGWTGED